MKFKKTGENAEIAKSNKPVVEAMELVRNLVVKKPYYYTGLFFLSLYFYQLVFISDMNWLATVQSDYIYRQVTGFILAIYILQQWRLAYLRAGRNTIALRQHMQFHRLLGSLAIVLLFMHTYKSGGGYQTLLWGVFLVGYITGLINHENSPIRKKYYLYGWLVVHIVCALLTTALLVFHVYVVYTYS